ncbi:MAG: hypothetical protein HRT74_08030, partial [Flavobacteriales bacterium]|nr:hypothetical protein [Flavobacteriales bacterium]
RGARDGLFDFYENQMEFPGMTEKPLLSPIASTGNLSYKYNYEGFFYENDTKVHRIYCEPLFHTAPLFEGTIFVEDSTYALIGVDLEVNQEALTIC